MPRRLLPTALAVVLAGLQLPAAASAIGIAQRTLRASTGVNGTAPDGGSADPFVSARGNVVAFDSTASNLTLDPNGRVRDVFVRGVATNAVRLVSEGPDGVPADGPSSDPVVTDDDLTVVFTSEADNLVAGDTNGATDVFARYAGDAVQRVSTAPGGLPANGASTQPDVSANGRYVVFTSTASNLVPADTNGVSDVFLVDRLTGGVARVSQPPGGQANGASSAPAISPDGRYVSFYSRATNLVRRDTNRLGDVFLADTASGRIRRVSVSSTGRQQNKSVIAPFDQVSDVSDDGRFVVFDSDATNLVPGDTNRDTDVFLRDVRRGLTGRVSLTVIGRQADNDSFYPRITPNGRYVVFDSFAGNMYPGQAKGENVFVRDLAGHITSLMTVTAKNRKRGREHVREILERPSISQDGWLIGLSSTAPLVSADRDTREDAYVRIAAPPKARITIRGGRYRLSADDPVAGIFPCALAGRFGLCPPTGNLNRLPHGRYKFVVRAIGMGTLLGAPTVKRFRR